MSRFAAVLCLIATLTMAFPAPAFGGEEKTLSDLVAELNATLDDDDAKWKDHWKAYRAFMARRDMLGEDKKANDEALAARAAAELEAGMALYEPLQGRVADAVRRSTLPWSGWIMGFFGASLLWGGFAVCVAIAIKDPVKIKDDAE